MAIAVLHKGLFCSHFLKQNGRFLCLSKPGLAMLFALPDCFILDSPLCRPTDKHFNIFLCILKEEVQKSKQNMSVKGRTQNMGFVTNLESQTTKAFTQELEIQCTYIRYIMIEERGTQFRQSSTLISCFWRIRFKNPLEQSRSQQPVKTLRKEAYYSQGQKS